MTDYTAQGNPCITHHPSEGRDLLWGVGTVYNRTLTYPLRPNTWGTREVYLSRDARASASIKETLEVRLKTASSTTSNVMALYLLSYRGKRSIDFPAQRNPCNPTVFHSRAGNGCHQRCQETCLCQAVCLSVKAVCQGKPICLMSRDMSPTPSGRKSLTTSMKTPYIFTCLRAPFSSFCLKLFLL